MKLITGLPVKGDGFIYDEEKTDRLLSFEQQTIMIEMSILNGFFKQQLTQPMVIDVMCGEIVHNVFRDSIRLIVRALIEAEVLSDTFYEKHKNIMDENGIRAEVELTTKQMYQIAHDVDYLAQQHFTVMGLSTPRDEKDEYYDSDFMFLSYDESKKIREKPL